MKSTKFVLIILCLLATIRFSYASEVGKICSSQLPIVELSFRQGQSNFAKVKAATLGQKPIAKFLTDFYKTRTYPQDEKSLVETVYKANKKFISTSDLKTKFLKYAKSTQRLGDPSGYRETVIGLIRSLITESKSRLDWYLNLKDPNLFSTQITPASGMEINDVYGAAARLLPIANGKFNSQIIFSNNESEPLPYLIPLIVHEIHHASTFKDRIKIYDNEQESLAYGIVDEAKAFDIQMATYLYLAQANPEVFCNWLYVTWSYGEIPVPLSWTMASMAKEMTDGKYIYKYAKMGSYKDAPYLLNQHADDLRPDLKARIKAMNLRFVK